MKKLVYIASLLIGIFCYTIAFSQVITTKKGALLYPIADLKVNDNTIKPVTTPIKLGKNKQLLYRGCTHMSEGFYYDGYVVSYEGNYYVVSPDFINENDLLQSENNQLDVIKKNLEDKIQEYQGYYEDEKFNKFLIRKRKRIESLSNRIDSVNTIMTQIDEKATKFAESVYNAVLADEQKFMSSFPQRLKGLCEKITIKQNVLHSPNSAGGCDYSFAYVNNSNKTIKYLVWKGVVYNAVGDKVPCTIRNIYTFTGRDTGPYPANFQYCGGTWDCIIYNYDADKFYLTSIAITYMDGTSYSVALQKDDYKKLTDYYLFSDIKSSKYKILDEEKKLRLSELKYEEYSKEKSELSKELTKVQNSLSDTEVDNIQLKLNSVKKAYEYFLINGNKKAATANNW